MQELSRRLYDPGVTVPARERVELPEVGAKRIAKLGIIDFGAVYAIHAAVLCGQERLELRISLDQVADER